MALQEHPIYLLVQNVFGALEPFSLQLHLKKKTSAGAHNQARTRTRAEEKATVVIAQLLGNCGVIMN